MLTNTKESLEKFRKFVAQQSRSRLSKARKNDSKGLYKKLDGVLKVSPNSFKLSWNLGYGNFQDKHTPPATINYDIAVTEKSTFSVSGTNTSLYTTSEIEYPEHTLKQNRNYQVGIVLSDRYGRQSTTILSPICLLYTSPSPRD